jgi:H+/Cl- antiporter ClcA
VNAAADLPADPTALIRSRQYRVLLVLAGLVGLVVSTASWGFLELVHVIQNAVYDDLPDALGYDAAPAWWSLPWLALAGLLTALAITRLPGRGGHVPAEGLKAGGAPTTPVELPGVLLAATATLGLGLALGPEAPLIAIGMGLGILSMRLVKRDAPQQALGLMAAAGSFAAVSAIFGSPVIGAVLILEATGLGGAMLPLVLLPGLVAAGIGSLVFIGLGSFSGFSTSAWSLSAFPLQPYGGPGWGDFGWTILLAVAVAVIAFVVLELARWTKRLVEVRLVPLTVAAGIAVGVLAMVYHYTSDRPAEEVLFSGETGFGALFSTAATTSLGTFALLMLFKGVVWSISLGNFRGGPTFPALYLGVVAGLMASELPGFGQTEAVATLSGAMCVAVLRLPLASVMIASILCFQAGIAVTPLVIVAVTVSYLVSLALTAFVDARVGAAPPEEPPARPEARPAR